MEKKIVLTHCVLPGTTLIIGMFLTLILGLGFNIYTLNTKISMIVRDITIFMIINIVFVVIFARFSVFNNPIFLAIIINGKEYKLRPYSNFLNSIDDLVIIQNYNNLSNDCRLVQMIGANYFLFIIIADILYLIAVRFDSINYLLILCLISVIIIIAGVYMHYYDKNIPLTLIVKKENYREKILICYHHHIDAIYPSYIKGLSTKNNFIHIAILKGKEKEIVLRYIAKMSLDELKKCLTKTSVV